MRLEVKHLEILSDFGVTYDPTRSLHQGRYAPRTIEAECANPRCRYRFDLQSAFVAFRILKCGNKPRLFCSRECTDKGHSEWMKENNPSFDSGVIRRRTKTLKAVMSKYQTEERRRKISLGVKKSWTRGVYNTLAFTAWSTQFGKQSTTNIDYWSKAENRQKQSLLKKKQIQNNPKLHPNFLAGKSRGHRSILENEMCEILKFLGKKHNHSKRVGNFWVDIMLRPEKSVLECDGEYWHKDVEKDIQRDAKILTILGPDWRIFHFSGKDINALYRVKDSLTEKKLMEKGVILVADY